MPSGLFKRKHHAYLEAIERVWVRYRPKTKQLQIYLQTNRRLPPTWVRGELSLSVCDRRGCHLTKLQIAWSNVNGSPSVGTAPCPPALAPKLERPLVADIGDIVLHAGRHERTLPADEPRSIEAANTSEPRVSREDVRWRIS